MFNRAQRDLCPYGSRMRCVPGEGADIIAVKNTVLVDFAIDAPVENKPSQG